MYILIVNNTPQLCSKDYVTLEEEIQHSIDYVLNNNEYTEQRHTEDEIWYFDGIKHHHKKYEIKQIQEI